ncbi:hypothetical protein EVA_02335 [gut metagenome]|uniref:Uncharacterized protein n=1 Tax=gut metagenome TaxID=749906 RepID=J9H1F8_9ZZZZ
MILILFLKNIAFLSSFNLFKREIDIIPAVYVAPPYIHLPSTDTYSPRFSNAFIGCPRNLNYLCLRVDYRQSIFTDTETLPYS